MCRKNVNWKEKKRRRTALKTVFVVPAGLSVLGAEGYIAIALAFAFRNRVQSQIARNMHLAFPRAQFGVVGGRHHHVVVSASQDCGWMIKDSNWVDHPPKCIMSDAICKLMELSRMPEDEAYDVIKTSLAHCAVAYAERRIPHMHHPL